VPQNDLSSPFSLASYWRLLQWILWDPAALEQYITDHVISKGLADAAPLPLRIGGRQESTWRQWWQVRASVRTFFSYLLTTIGILLVLIEFVAVLITLTILPPADILSNLLFSAATGVLMLILFFILIGFLADGWALATIWGTYYSLGLPVLVLHVLWMPNGTTPDRLWQIMEFNLVTGLWFGLMLNSVTGTLTHRFSGKIADRRLFYLMAWGLGIFFFFIVVLYNSQYITPLGVGMTASCAAVALIAAVAAVVRLDDFLLACWRLPNPDNAPPGVAPTLGASAQHRWEERLRYTIPRVTYLAPPQLSLLLEDWLEQNWVQGVHNAHQLWRYTNLQHLVIRKIQEVLQETPSGELLEKIEKIRVEKGESIGRGTYQWHLAEFIDEPTPYATVNAAIHNQFHTIYLLFSQNASNHPKRRKEYRQAQRIHRFSTRHPLIDNRHINTPWQAALAGFVHAEMNLPQQAAEAFAKVKGSAYAAELHQINQAIVYLIRNENLVHTEPSLTLPRQPKQAQRKSTWEALKTLQDILHYAWLYRRCRPLKRDVVRQEIERKIQQLLRRKNQFDEDIIFKRLAQLWQAQLEAWFAEAETLKLKEISLPYCYTEPLRTTHTFQGRQPQLQVIKQAWTPGQLQPLLLYGQPLIGKTSLLCNAALAHAQSVAVAIVNVALVNRGTDVITRLFLNICGEVERVVFHTAPDNYALEQHLTGNPYQFAQNYIRDICQQLRNRVLVVALDNIEALFLLQNPTKTNSLAFSPTPAALDSFMNTLWHLSHHVHNLTFVFVTKQMPGQLLPLSQDFFNTMRFLKVSYLEEGDVTTLLQEPVPNFLPCFTQGALTSVYQLTAGQPFLVQLLGSCLVQHYNRQVKSEQPLDPLFSASDVAKVVTDDPEFIQQSQRYFVRLLAYLKTINPDYEPILRAVAAKPAGCSQAEISTAVTAASAKPVANLQQQLQSLQKHEVIYTQNNKWFIRVELLERWL